MITQSYKPETQQRFNEMNNKDVKILIVDDEPDIIEILRYNLDKEGYTTYTADNGKAAIDKAKAELPHLIILDIMMPDMDGIETCRELRAIPDLQQVLIAFLTARNEDYSQIAGFDVGADDYIKKPIKPRVLTSRVKGLLRRIPQEEVSSEVKFRDLVINKEQYLVYKNGKEISLPRKEFEILLLLAKKPGKVFSREEILEMVWEDDIIVGDRTIDVHVRKLREKIDSNYIKTVKGVGYKLEQPD
jgi:two-component system alkaline phosphatase synthesis response regulator PhoP